MRFSSTLCVWCYSLVFSHLDGQILVGQPNALDESKEIEMGFLVNDDLLNTFSVNMLIIATLMILLSPFV